MWTIEVRDNGRWRRVRHVQAMTVDEAAELVGMLTKWELGIFRSVKL